MATYALIPPEPQAFPFTHVLHQIHPKTTPFLFSFLYQLFNIKLKCTYTKLPEPV